MEATTPQPDMPREAAAVSPQFGTSDPAPPPLPGTIVAQPPAVDPVPPGGVVYKVDSSRAGFGELWRDSGSVLVLLTKPLRVRLPGSVNDPNVESLRPFEVPLTSLPQDVRE